MLDSSYKNTAQKILRRTGKILYMFVSLLERVLLFLLEKTKNFLEKSFDEKKKVKTGVDNFLDNARDVPEADLLEKRQMKFEMDIYVNDKLDEIIFFRVLLNDSSFPAKRIEQLKNMENEIFNQLLTYSELQKRNMKAEVALIGAFSSGKSTIINSFLKKEVCPSDPSPTTSSVTKFYFSNNETIKLNGKEISSQEYADKVRHKNSGKDTKTYFFEYGHTAEVFNSIVLYDTPGFGNGVNKNDDEVTEDILKEVDVVIYTVDINKGSLDQQDIERLRKLKKQKNKKFYCIMNKADEVSSQAIIKIKKQIEKFDIFDMIIAYSAKNVLKASTRFSIENFLESTKKKIYDKTVFESVIRGEVHTRRKNKEFYRLMLDTQEIDDDGINAIIQRGKLERIFNDISMQKYHILEKSFNENEERYKLRAKNMLNDILSEIDTYEMQGINSDYNDTIEEVFQQIRELESTRSKDMFIAIVDAYKKALSLKHRTVKGMIFDDHYYWVNFNKTKFDKHLDDLKELYEKIIDTSKDLFGKVENDFDINIQYPELNKEYLSRHAIDILQYLSRKTIMIKSSEEYTSKDEAKKTLNDCKKYAKSIIYANSIINKKNLDKYKYRLANDIESLNLKTIEHKSGMLQQDINVLDESKSTMKVKIKNYLKKGEKNA